MISTSKNYKYFFRGQYVVTADVEDVQAAKTAEKKEAVGLRAAFEAIRVPTSTQRCPEQQNPEVVLSLIEELVEREALHIALANRDEDEVIKLMDFLVWKLPDHRYATVLLEVARITLDMYAGVVGLSDRFDNKLFNQMNLIVADQVKLQKGLLELSG
eukprot:CAMPEP_0170471526 /NCGR_PEP_ID=MMETSP0123-20130129/13720_1 /TAXON_ID=182087 /ORGANISM="Favella ehrenbergii, Strain Fehren 1" /LENGTH=157 /DNA_ID=CAMNT_0010739211 /DNA_START=1025 /DNA_END=1498 /DNA_ORIENTATION=-